MAVTEDHHHRRFGPGLPAVAAALRSGRGSTPAPPLEETERRDAVVDWALYVHGVRLPIASYRDAVRMAREGGGFVWIGLYEPSADELNHVAGDFDLHPLAVEDAVHAHQRPKLERYDEMVFSVFKTVRYCPHDEVTEHSEIVETGEVMVFVGGDFVVTVRHGDFGGLQAVRQRLEADASLLGLGPSAVLYGVADHIVDAYLDVSERIEDDLDEIEAQVFSYQHRRDVGRIYQVKRELLELRRAVAPLAVPLRTLAERPMAVIDDEIREYFRDVEDHLTRSRELISGYEELLGTIVQASLAQLSIAENEDMRRITAWAAIIAVPTAIAGIYGMNFDHMPELNWIAGYPAALLLMTLVCVGLYANFKRRGWL